MCAGIHSEDSFIHYREQSRSFNHSRSTFTLHLRRKYLYYLIHLIIPYCLFSWLAIFTFILQPSRPERLNIGMTLMLLVISKIFFVTWKNAILLTSVDLMIIKKFGGQFF